MSYDKIKHIIQLPVKKDTVRINRVFCFGKIKPRLKIKHLFLWQHYKISVSLNNQYFKHCYISLFSYAKGFLKFKQNFTILCSYRLI